MHSTNIYSYFPPTKILRAVCWLHVVVWEFTIIDYFPHRRFIILYKSWIRPIKPELPLNSPNVKRLIRNQIPLCALMPKCSFIQTNAEASNEYEKIKRKKKIVNQGIKQKKRTLWYHVHSSKNWRNHLKLSKSHLVMDLQRIYNEFGTSYFSICLP